MTTARAPGSATPVSSSSRSTPSGVQGRSPGSPATRCPWLTGWSPSTSFSGDSASSTARASSGAGSGSCTRMPWTSPRRPSSRTSATSSCCPTLAARRCPKERIPTSAHAFSLLPTYRRDAGSSPTSTVARPGTTSRAASRATRSRTSLRTAAATLLPSIVCPTEEIPVPPFYRGGPGGGKSRRRASRTCYTRHMTVGVPREVKQEENRVALTPSGVGALVGHGHAVVVERGAGLGSSFPDALYRDAGATLADAATVWARAELVLKVKEPVPAEYALLRPAQVLFTYLHLAANPDLARALVERKVRALAYETLQADDGSLPLLAPTSEIAGRLAVQVGAWCLQAQNGGRGVLLSGASGVRPAKIVILGAGIAGTNACQVAVGVGAHVAILDVSPAKLRYVHDILGGHVTTVMSNRANVEEEVTAADLVVGAVLIPGARSPRLLSRALVSAMRRGAALVDLSIDQGGTAETSRPTTLADPIYRIDGVVHYAVTNMPGMVPHTSTFALTNATLSYALDIADQGFVDALRSSSALRRACNLLAGRVTHPGVATSLGMT